MVLELIIDTYISAGPVLVRVGNPGYVAVPDKADMSDMSDVSVTRRRVYLKLLSESAYYTWLGYCL